MMNGIKVLTMIVLTTLFMGVIAQDELSRSLGNLSSHHWDGSSLDLTTTHGKLRITVFNDHIIRVQAVQKDFQKDFSYAVVLNPVQTLARYKENRGFIEISTSAIRLVITINPVRLAFYSIDGQLLNEDDAGFGIAWQGQQVTNYKTLQPEERFIGLGAKTGNLDRFGSAFVNWNTDNPHYEKYSDPLYSSIPFYMGIVNEQVYGIYFDNSYRTQFNFGASNDRFSYFSADGGELDYYFIHDSGVAPVVKLFGELTGKMPMPPLWSLGYQQCRWSYTPDEEVLNVAKTLRQKKIPADVMYLDIDFMDAYKIFTWHPEHFSNPAALLSELKSMNFHTTVIVDPGIKVEKGYHAFEDGLKKQVFAVYPDGTPFTAQVWPGWCHFPDFTSEKGRNWWGAHFQDYVSLGVDGFWNDMNEIATWGQQVPSLVEFDWEGRRTTYRQAKNVYGMLMAKATFEGTKKLMSGRRPFSLTRAGFAGLQRYTAIWTGDNQAHDDHMLLGIRLVNTLGLSGVAFAGYDVGGFGGDASPELYSRWITIGAFAPFFRGHTSKNTQRSEPWSYGEIPESIARRFIGFRYKLMPYIYSTFREAALNGLPVQRSLALDYYNDDRIYKQEYENQYLFGQSLMVAPVSSTQLAAKVFLPHGKWFDLYNDQVFIGDSEFLHPAPLDRLPLFVKAGSIIPLQSLVQSTSEKPLGMLELHVYQSDSASNFLFYEDDGTTYDFESDQYFSREIKLNGAQKSLVFEAAKGRRKSIYTSIRVVMHGFEEEVKQLTLNGKELRFIQSEAGYLGEFSSEFLPGETFQFIIDHSEQQMIINW